MHGASYNLVLIGVPLLFWAAVKRRAIAAAAVRAWRAHRRAQAAKADLSPAVGPDITLPPLPQVSPSREGAGETSGRGAGGGPGEGPGERAPQVVDILDDGTHGVWIKVGRGDTGSDEGGASGHG